MKKVTHIGDLKQTKLFGRLGQLFSSLGVYADELTSLTLVFEFDEAFDQSKERVVLAAADVVAGFPLSSALTCENVAAEHTLAAEFLKPEPLRMRIAAVT
jgi:hypothetical protein